PSSVVRQLDVTCTTPLEYPMVHHPHNSAVRWGYAKKPIPIFYARPPRRCSLPMKEGFHVEFGQIKVSARSQVVGHCVGHDVRPNAINKNRPGLKNRVTIDVKLGVDGYPWQERTV